MGQRLLGIRCIEARHLAAYPAVKRLAHPRSARPSTPVLLLAEAAV
jgi:hypothetical protein